MNLKEIIDKDLEIKDDYLITEEDNQYIKGVIKNLQINDKKPKEVLSIITKLLNKYKKNYDIINIDDKFSELFTFDNGNLMGVFGKGEFLFNIDNNIGYIKSIKMVTDYYINHEFEEVNKDDITTYINYSENLENLETEELDRDEITVIISDLLTDLYNHLIFD